MNSFAHFWCGGVFALLLFGHGAGGDGVGGKATKWQRHQHRATFVSRVWGWLFVCCEAVCECQPGPAAPL